MNKVLIFHGFYRSGASLLTSWLQKCGLHMGDRFACAASNAKDDLEDLDFRTFHKEMLMANNIDSMGLFLPANIWMDPYQERKMEYLIRFKNSMHIQWGWSDPRTGLFSEKYAQHLPQAKYLIIFRDYSYVVDSLIRCQKKELRKWYANLGPLAKITGLGYYRQKITDLSCLPDIYLASWCRYYQHLLELTAGLPAENFYTVRYQDLQKNEIDLFAKLAEEWGFELKFFAYSAVFDVSVMNELRPAFSFDQVIENRAKLITKALTGQTEMNRYRLI